MAKIPLEHLDAEHFQPFRQALSNMLSTPVAESTYAQIIDGMPLSATVQAYQNTPPGSVAWKLRLLELLTVAIHDIAATLWSLDDGVHKHAELEAWLTSRLESGPLDENERANLPPHTWFWHYDYEDHKQYPKGVADVVGYWAETQIFGGVVLFDRGESDEECNGVYLHSANISMYGYTIAPPTEDQFNDLIGFLLSPSPDTAQSPLPIAITTANKWRWDPWDAMGTYHIFRDRYERKLPPRHLYRRKHNVKFNDWPELADISILRREAFSGIPVSEAEKAAAKERLMQITPSSRYWQYYKDEICRLQPVKKMQGRPPYFFDA
ncbi:hypothetical protein SLS64_009543 [Diaporthe eres]|uniref:Uncharacterized protein n=1 Tax=Diaporthe eres TaxID=83184 RepID=A0ABR1P938_DIAER